MERGVKFLCVEVLGRKAGQLQVLGGTGFGEYAEFALFGCEVTGNLQLPY